MQHSELEILARGLVIRRHEGRHLVLVCRSVKGGYCYLPGGHVEFDEPATEALERELVEEAGLIVTVGALVLVSEERFDQASDRRHEYTFVFHVEHLVGEDRATPVAERPPFVVESREENIAFEWIPIDTLRDAALRPARLATWLANGGSDGIAWHSS